MKCAAGDDALVKGVKQLIFSRCILLCVALLALQQQYDKVAILSDGKLFVQGSQGYRLKSKRGKLAIEQL